MAGLGDCISLVQTILSIRDSVEQNKALCAQLLRRVDYCGEILRSQQQQQSAAVPLVTETFQDLFDTLTLVMAYVKKYTKKRLGRKFFRAIYAGDDRSQFDDCKDRIDRCIDRLPVVQNMDQSERMRLAEENRIADFTELKDIINTSVQDVINAEHEGNHTLLESMDELKGDLHEFIAKEVKGVFDLRPEEFSELQNDMGDKLAAIDRRQQETLEVLGDVSSGVKSVKLELETMRQEMQDMLSRLQLNPNSRLNELESKVREDKISELELDVSAFELVEVPENFLGEGSFGHVYKVYIHLLLTIYSPVTHYVFTSPR